MSTTRLVVTRGRGASRPDVRVETAGPRGRGHLAARILPPRGGVARVALLAEGALLLGGDEVEVHLVLGAGVRVEVVEPAGTVAYDMRGDRASWRVRVEAGDNSRMTWRGQSFVVSNGAQVERSTTVDLGARAVVAWRELLVLGRTGEAGGRLHTTTRVACGGPLLVEDLVLDGSQPRVGVLGSARVLETISVVGCRAAPGDLVTPAHRLELDREGTVLRWWGSQAHESSLGAAWRAVVRDLSAPRPSAPDAPPNLPQTMPAHEGPGKKPRGRSNGATALPHVTEETDAATATPVVAVASPAATP